MTKQTKRTEMPIQLRLDLERNYLVHRSEIDKIDALVSALNLAITEILEWRPVKSDPMRTTPAQNAYDKEIADIIYRNEQIDF